MSNYQDVSLPVTFTVNVDNLDEIKLIARECDDENLGEHQDDYTVEQAVIVAFHNAPEKLLKHHLVVGWAVDQASKDEFTGKWIEAEEA